jgi:hypothetical protein
MVVSLPHSVMSSTEGLGKEDRKARRDGREGTQRRGGEPCDSERSVSLWEEYPGLVQQRKS